MNENNELDDEQSNINLKRLDEQLAARYLAERELHRSRRWNYILTNLLMIAFSFVVWFVFIRDGPPTPTGSDTDQILQELKRLESLIRSTGTPVDQRAANTDGLIAGKAEAGFSWLKLFLNWCGFVFTSAMLLVLGSFGGISPFSKSIQTSKRWIKEQPWSIGLYAFLGISFSVGGILTYGNLFDDVLDGLLVQVRPFYLSVIFVSTSIGVISVAPLPKWLNRKVPLFVIGIGLPLLLFRLIPSDYDNWFSGIFYTSRASEMWNTLAVNDHAFSFLLLVAIILLLIFRIFFEIGRVVQTDETT